ncbi:MAG TPA: 1-hydroxycarotenoid 3,4-desaturase CrtD, partial [Flavitalea sp.]|nr:1-hydroxycarotenoid 3,4-desaturase CrtD [Flavitalea sp.]
MAEFAIVIGSGVGGLAVAIRLAVKGYRVRVYEKNSEAGGKISICKKDGYVFDSGPSVFTQPGNIEELFALAGEPIEDYFRYKPVPLACRYFWENGKQVNAYTHPESLARELESKLGEDPVKVRKYLEKANQAYNAIGSIFLEQPLQLSKTWFNKRIFPAISATRIRYLLSSMHGYNSSAFRSAEAVQIFDRFATYNGSNPYKAPAMLTMIPNLEHNEGLYYPEGGMISIAKALVKLAQKKGVEFVFNTKVEKISQEGGKIKGIVIDGQLIKADKVISNMDVFYVYRDLLKDQKASAKVLSRERSSSALIFYWGIKKEFPSLHLHNIFFSKNYAAEFEHIFKQQKIFDDPTVYVNITSKMEHGFAPGGHENWFVMINAPADTGQDWKSMRTKMRTAVLQKLQRILGENIEPLIATEMIMDPVDISNNTLSHLGSLYGTSSNSLYAAFLRHPNFSSSTKGLYFTGGSVHPGG